MEELYVTQEDMRKVNLNMEEIFKAIDALTATVELNRQGEITKLNDRLLQTLSFSAQDLYGKSIRQLLIRDHEETKNFPSLWQEILDGKSAEKVSALSGRFQTNTLVANWILSAAGERWYRAHHLLPH